MSDRGSIVTQTFTARKAILITGVSVSFLTTDVGKPRLEAHRITGETGKTEPVWFDVPDENLSLKPDASDNKPFLTCDIRFDKENYYSILVKDVQVFAGVESLQQIEMFPLPEHSSPGDRSVVFIVNAQDL